MVIFKVLIRYSNTIIKTIYDIENCNLHRIWHSIVEVSFLVTVM